AFCVLLPEVRRKPVVERRKSRYRRCIIAVHTLGWDKLSTDTVNLNDDRHLMLQTGAVKSLFEAQGIARSSTLLRTGWTRHSIEKAVTSGRLLRPRRGWVARADCDPQLLLAAHHGVLLS